MLTPTDAFICASLLFVASLLWSRNSRASSLPLPPGPRRHWLLGNLKDMPRVKPWHKFQEWASTYGPVMSLSLPGGKTMIFLNTMEAINDLLEKKSAAYSDRPTNVMCELMGYHTTSLSRISSCSKTVLFCGSTVECAAWHLGLPPRRVIDRSSARPPLASSML